MPSSLTTSWITVILLAFSYHSIDIMSLFYISCAVLFFYFSVAHMHTCLHMPKHVHTHGSAHTNRSGGWKRIQISNLWLRNCEYLTKQKQDYIAFQHQRLNSCRISSLGGRWKEWWWKVDAFSFIVWTFCLVLLLIQMPWLSQLGTGKESEFD